MNIDEKQIKSALEKAFIPDIPPESPYPPRFFTKNLLPAAVLIPFLHQDDSWHILFIRRTYNERDRHKGQVAFPGGRCNSSDLDTESAALRETYEETSILREDIKILGRLRDIVTITGYRVTPYVGSIPWPYPVKPQPSEVSRIFTIPFNWLANPENRTITNRELQVQKKTIPVIHYKPYQGEILWGASARITLILLEALGLSDPGKRYAG